ncbi:ABC transporter ATP-binding protein [Pseudomonas sp. MMS21-TM103]|uniref:ABC transporter ATP-binding protein n=1 Tax=Pseudomonas sp. MMS21 TM103 TaxID=2886506 RepID=UPI001EDDB2F2|nr:ABC transporter ATP-binding protein [Pseudomonas sp. MMS21 TM103]MCG4451849.1 ABC transporter ATP-binding protein [Pseudomonas sp. MMS21 TM103]
MIELSNVSKLFDQTRAVDDISLTVPTGELCVLVGTSGCGKSTTLRMINRLITHSAGSIRINGRDIEQIDPQQLRRGIGYAIQSTGLFPHWTVARNIAVVPRLLGWPTARVRQRVEELLQLLELAPAEFADKYPRQLSGGQAQRVGVARALAGDPDILLMDEPFGALDPITRESLQNELLRIQQQVRKTIVFVTHDMDEALKLANRIVVMDKGRIVQQDSPQALLAKPANAFVENLLGGQERGLKQAGLLRVDSLMQALATAAIPAAGPALKVTDSLRQALSLMLWHRRSSLPVVDAQGLQVGVLQLDALMSRPQ